jgi:hypothetical protein
MAKSYLTANALVFVAQAAVVIAAAAISEEASASKPCNPDPAVPCNAPPKKTPVPGNISPLVPIITGSRPAAGGDIVGRDLGSTGLPYLGHLGVSTNFRPSELSDNNISILEMSSEHARNPKRISLAEFKAKALDSQRQYWGAVYENWGGPVSSYSSDPFAGGYDNSTGYYVLDIAISPVEAIVSRALAIAEVLGNEYTLTAISTPMRPASRVNRDRVDPPIRGIYRCDTFAFDTYRRATGDLNLGAPQDFSGWINFMSPITFFNRFNSR